MTSQNFQHHIEIVDRESKLFFVYVREDIAFDFVDNRAERQAYLLDYYPGRIATAVRKGQNFQSVLSNEQLNA